MKGASETDQDGILDSAFYHSGESIGWSVFGAGRYDPAEILARKEAGEDDFPIRSAVLSILLDLSLEGWERENDPFKVGGRGLSVAAALAHAKSRGAVPMLGVHARFGSEGLVSVARDVLDIWLHDDPDEVALGKRVLAVGRFLNHPFLAGWSVRSLARVCGESRTWMSKRVRKECNAPIESVGGYGEATWQQGKNQRAKSARNARGPRDGNKSNKK